MWIEGQDRPQSPLSKASASSKTGGKVGARRIGCSAAAEVEFSRLQQSLQLPSAVRSNETAEFGMLQQLSISPQANTLGWGQGVSNMFWPQRLSVESELVG